MPGKVSVSPCALSPGRGLCFPLVKTCVFGNEPKAPDEVPLAARAEPVETSPTWQALKLLFCASGLQVGRWALPLSLGGVPEEPARSPHQSQQLAGGCVCVFYQRHTIILGVVGGNTVFSFLFSHPLGFFPSPSTVCKRDTDTLTPWHVGVGTSVSTLYAKLDEWVSDLLGP